MKKMLLYSILTFLVADYLVLKEEKKNLDKHMKLIELKDKEAC